MGREYPLKAEPLLIHQRGAIWLLEGVGGERERALQAGKIQHSH